MATALPQAPDRTVEIVRQWGGVTTDAILDPTNQRFFAPGIEGVVGYRIESGRIVVFGEPACDPSVLPSLIHSFHRFAAGQSLRIVYIAVSKPFVDWLRYQFGGMSVAFGRQLLLDPNVDPQGNTGEYASLLRRKVRRALKEGAVVSEYKGGDDRLKQSIEDVGRRWLEARSGPQIHYSHIRLFDAPEGKRWLYATVGEEVVATLTMSAIEQRGGCLLNHLMVAPGAPSGLSELLIVEALGRLDPTKVHWATAGVVTAQELSDFSGFGRLSRAAASAVFASTRQSLHLDGRYKFWQKFAPEEIPSYLWIDGKRVRARDFIGLFRALNVSSSQPQ